MAGAKFAKVAGGALFAGALAATSASPALAYDDDWCYPVQGQGVEADHSGFQSDYQFQLQDQGGRPIGDNGGWNSAALFDVGAGDNSLQSYCIEAENLFEKGDGDLVTWGDFDASNKFANEDVQKAVGWILQNSFPKVDLEELGKAAKIKNLSEDQAVTATQAAIWHETEDATLGKITDSKNKKVEKSDEQAINKLYDYLTGEENTGVDLGRAGTKVELEVDKELTFKGDYVGAVTVKSTGNKAVKLSVTEASGVKGTPDNIDVVSSSGEEVDLKKVKPGTKLFVKTDNKAQEGSVTFSVKGEKLDYTGAVYQPSGEDAQSVIAVDSEPESYTSKATMKWTRDVSETSTSTDTTAAEETEGNTGTDNTDTTAAEETEGNTGTDNTDTTAAEVANEQSLPVTGSNIAVAGLVALALIGGGAATIYGAKRKRH